MAPRNFLEWPPRKACDLGVVSRLGGVRLVAGVLRVAFRGFPEIKGALGGHSPSPACPPLGVSPRAWGCGALRARSRPRGGGLGEGGRVTRTADPGLHGPPSRHTLGTAARGKGGAWPRAGRELAERPGGAPVRRARRPVPRRGARPRLSPRDSGSPGLLAPAPEDRASAPGQFHAELAFASAGPAIG